MIERRSEILAPIIDLCKQGDNTAWHELIDLVAPLLFSICRKSKLSRDESFDIFGQVCLDLVRNIHTVRSPKRIFSFVATITRRKIFNFYQKMHLAEYFDADSIPLLAVDKEKAPDALYEDIRRRELLLEALQKLPKRDYALLRALFFDSSNPSYEEIARRLKCPQSSIGPTRARALAKLARILKQKRYKF
jgi:RNA polymerase sigma factor (sigma-70 family)